MAGGSVLFVYDVSILPEWQGRGYGRAAMRFGGGARPPRAASTHIELNVFGGNEVARNLYRSLGYVETSVQMRKELASDVDLAGATLARSSGRRPTARN